MLLDLIVMAAAVAAPAPACEVNRDAGAHVRAVATGIVDADNASALERVLAYYAADAMLLPPGEAPVTGQGAIRPRYEALFAAFKPEIVGRVDEVCVSGPLAFVRGHNGGQLRSRTGGPDRALDDVYLMLLARGAGARWRITHLIWHRAGRESPAAPEARE